jgi:RNA polymerase sigma factor (sigma-70 family)
MHSSEEFKTRVLPLQPSLYRFAKTLLRDTQEAEDCVQEMLLRLWSRRESLSAVDNITAFAMKMTRNFCLDKLKARKHLVDISKEIIPSTLDLHRQVEMNDAVARIETIMSFLPEQQRSLIHLRNIEGLEMNEIADITGLSVEHARVTLSRARIAIRQLYEKQYGQA